MVGGGWRMVYIAASSRTVPDTELKVELRRSGQLELLLDPAEENSELEAIASGW